jgi:hypothetical protein
MAGRITIRIRIEFTITIQTTTLKRTMTYGQNGADRHMDGPIRCSSLTLHRNENQKEHGKFIKQ